ncbi:free fatty acid receptor 2-like [Polyodon spathula]|uniref:free fatty acid receptor 2-like n=1 Tax=Polyodon spathula TaxID=7913 RepID=UPI001B7F2332|nr:free fatty acid receptor 2-like [Polyodon spathula]
MTLSPHDQLILSVYILTFMTGLPTNILAFYTFFIKVCRKPAPIDILLLNPLSNFIFYSTIYISTLFRMGVSVERYLGVAYPVQYKMKCKPTYAIMASLFFWVISTAHCSIVYIIQYQKPGNGTWNVSTCYEDFTEEQLDVLLLVRFDSCLILFYIPFLITSFCYISFIRILLSLPNISRRRKQRAIGLALGTLLVFNLCFCPYNISHVVGFVKWQSPTWHVDALLPSTFYKN